MDFTKRKRQVFGESVEGTLPSTSDYMSTLMAIQDHHAHKAGRHFDIRFKIGDKAVSFVTRSGLPQEPGQVKMLVRTPNHRVDYMKWEGEIPRGEYGAGRVLLHDAQDVVVKSEPEKLHVDIHSGPNAGSYVIFKSMGQWFVTKKKALEGTFDERMKFKAIKSPGDIPNKQDYIPLDKLDGAQFHAKINAGGLSFTSASKSTSGDEIRRDYQVPHLRDARAKKFEGAEIKGELWHPLGFNRLSGILNSAPSKAVQTQLDEGRVMFAPFDIIKTPDGRSGKDLPYFEKLRMLQDIVKAFKNKYISLPGYALRNKEKFENEIIGQTDREGIIYRHKSDPTAPSYKFKNWYDYDLRIRDVFPGSGKYQDKAAGGLALEDASGRFVGNVGSGFSDEIRRMLHEDPRSVIGRIVRIKSMQPLVDKLRAPVFQGWSDKSEPDIIKTSGINSAINNMIERSGGLHGH